MWIKLNNFSVSIVCIIIAFFISKMYNMPNERIKTSTENFRIQVNNRKRRSKLEKHGESVLNNRLSGKKDVWGNFHD